MPVPTAPIPVPFPVQGINENSAYGVQPPTTAPDALNVRAYDSLERRNRGGQRTGMSRWSALRPSGGSSPIQLIDGIPEAIDPNQNATVFAATVPPLTAPTVTWPFFHPDGDVIFLAAISGTGAGTVYAYNWTEAGGIGSLIDSLDVVTALSWSALAKAGQCSPLGGAIVLREGASGQNVGFVPFNKVSGFGTPQEQGTAFSATGGNDQVAISPSGAYVAIGGSDAVLGPVTEIRAWTDGAGLGSVIDTLDNPGSAGTLGIAWHPDSDHFYIGNDNVSNGGAYPFDGSTIGSRIAPPFGIAGPAWNSTGSIVLGVDLNDVLRAFSFVKSPATLTALDDDNQLTSASLTGWGAAWHPDEDYVVGNRPRGTGAPGVLAWTGTAFGAEADGAASTIADYSSTAINVQFSPGGEWLVYATDDSTFGGLGLNRFAKAQSVVTGRRTRVVVVAGGSIYDSINDGDSWNSPSSGASALEATGRVDGTPAFGDYFFVDGADDYRYLDVSANTVSDWDSAVTAGSLPTGSGNKGASIAALYRGRVVLSGLETDPQNWFMSASGDPFDFDYSPATTSATQAVAGNVSDVGLIGDVVTALIPFSDDLLFIGGDQTLWLMRGDPAAGGEVDAVSRGIGVVGPDAWTIDDTGTLYFFGNNGLYRLSAGGGFPELVSQGRLDRTFSDIDTAANAVRLVYDREWQAVHIFIAPLSQPSTATFHYIYDRRNDAFWKDQYPAAFGPRSIYLFDGPVPDDRAVLIGGYDGYIRQFDPDVLDDDGTAITSYVVLAPLVGRPESRIKMTRLTAIFDRNGDDVLVECYKGDTPEQAVNDAIAGASPYYSVEVEAGRSKPLLQHASAPCLCLRLENSDDDETWATEQLSAVIHAPAGLATENAG